MAWSYSGQVCAEGGPGGGADEELPVRGHSQCYEANVRLGRVGQKN